MKKIISALAMIAVAGIGLSGCTGASAGNGSANGTAAADMGDKPDYSKAACWYKIPEISKDVDTFYIYSTAYFESSFKEGAPDHAPLDNPEMLEGVKAEYVTNASVYEGSTNVFVPYYRQAGMRYATEIRKKTGNIDAALAGKPYEDIRAALDCYFKNHNNGRPFIIAGHSQGSSMVKYVLVNYFKEHPEYYKRMVAAYVIGFSVTKDDLEKNPHLKFAAGESDTGVIISWNTEGPKNVKENANNAVVLPNAISINPLNWKLDETYAPASQNLGSFMPNIKARRYEITDIGADAQVVLKRGVIVTNAKYDHPAAAEFFGPQSYHEDDYTFYYNNLKDNVAKRVAAYKEHAGAPDYSRRSCWYRLPRITKAVDTFFVYPTEYLGMKKGDPDYAPLDNPEMQDGVKNIDYKFMASAYRKSTNVFIPYYRQAGLRLERDAWKKTGDIRTALTGIPYQDITAALDCYFKKYNKGRPFILAGHSQGSAICTLLLKKYFKEHPEYYKRMVAAYIIGFSVTKDELEANPHLKFAAGETDTGVIVSWNTEGPRNVETNAPNAATLPNAISINPLNWKLDGTYAPPSENRGSLVPDEKTGEIRIGDLGADAQVVPDRGVIVTNARFDPMEKTELFGPQSFHNGDYLFYYNNLRDNVAKRIATYKARDRKEQEPDYSRKSCWFKFPGITKDVDTFYVYATEYIMGSLEKGAPEYATLDNVEMLHGVAEEYKIHATAFEASSNLFMPYYRQAGMPVMKKAWKKTGNVEAAISGMPYGDITAALDYYFKNCNNGRPFILAGHSQGSAIVKYALKNYFKKHPEYLKRMVAAYVIGYSVTKDELKAYPHLKFAAGETDTGVIISWNTEGPGNVAKNASTAVLLPKAVSINPLNWKRDGTYAPASKNLGSLVANEKTGELEIGDLGADAKVNLARGTVVTNAKAVPMNEEAARVAAEFFGPDGRHGDDYTYYYNNIKDNVAKRIDAYQKKAMQPK